MARDHNQKFIRRGWYEARTANNNSRIVYIDNPDGYSEASSALGIAPHWVGSNLDSLINEQEGATVIAPDDWRERPRRYGIGSRHPDTTERDVFGRSSRYKKWKRQRMRDNRHRTRPPGNRGHYGPARSAMAGHLYPYTGNIPFDRRTQNQYNIGPSPRVGLLASGDKCGQSRNTRKRTRRHFKRRTDARRTNGGRRRRYRRASRQRPV